MNKRNTILVVDDDRQVRDALSIRLAQAGFEVVTAANANDGIAAFALRRPDAVILDVQMPDKDGFSVCEHIRSTGSNVPVIFLTGAMEGIIRRNLAALTSAVGANYYLTKPFDGKMLTMMVQEALEHSRTGPVLAGAND